MHLDEFLPTADPVPTSGTLPPSESCLRRDMLIQFSMFMSITAPLQLRLRIVWSHLRSIWEIEFRCHIGLSTTSSA